jgi:uncharacterized protein YcfJ
VNNTVLSGIIVGGVVLAAAGAIMVNSGYNPLQQYATVVSVQPAFDTVRTPRPVCGDDATLAKAQAQAEAGVTAVPGSSGTDRRRRLDDGARRPTGAYARAECGGHGGRRCETR